MRIPKKLKYRKAFKGKIKGRAKAGMNLNFGTYGLKALEPFRIYPNQIESARRTIMSYVRREGKLWIRVFPAIPVTKKPAEVRMGSGKGSPEGFIARIKPGVILFEISGVEKEIAEEALRKAASKLPGVCRFIARID